MKKHPFILVVILLLSASSCRNDGPSELLPGSWQVREASTRMPGIRPDLLETADRKQVDNLYEFHPDGSFYLESHHGRYTGRWTWSGSDSLIGLSYRHEVGMDTLSYDLKLGRIDRKELRFRQDYGEGSYTLFLLERIR